MPTKIPDFLKSILRPIYRAVISSRLYRKVYRIRYPASPRDLLLQYWKSPWDGSNIPREYLEGRARSLFLVEIVKRYNKTNARILEIGSNVGRNLNYLFLAGFKELSGIEISENAVQLLKELYPEMASHVKIYNISVEELIKDFKDGEFDVVFTMAVLEHIHPDSEWVFPQVARITKHVLITIEDELSLSWRHFPRNYKDIFEPLGMKQVEALNCSDVDGLGNSFFARIFRPMPPDC